MNSNWDEVVRLAAFQCVGKLQRVYGGAIPWSEIAKGVQVGSDHILLANKARGIFKPRQMDSSILSIKTVFPREGRERIYDDDFVGSQDYYRYALQDGGPGHGSNVFLEQAKERRDPIVYFFGVSPGFYSAIFPAYIESFFEDGGSWFCSVTVGEDLELWSDQKDREVMYRIPEISERRYLVRESKNRLHQASFREAVISAYREKCAVTGLPVRGLLEAAHITPDAKEIGAPSINNGISLNRIHHKAYDANLIGISPDYDVIVGPDIMEASDGVLLESGIKGYHNKKIMLPNDEGHWPDKDSLAARFEEFKKAR